MKIKLTTTSTDLQALDDTIRKIVATNKPDIITVNPTIRDDGTETHSRTLTWENGFSKETLEQFTTLTTTKNVSYSVKTI